MVWKPKKKESKWNPDWEKIMEKRQKGICHQRKRKQEDKQSIEEGMEEYGV